MQGSTNQMISPMPQGHMMGLNQMQHSGPSPAGNIPPPNMGGFPNGLTNIQGAPGSVGLQNFPMGGMFNRPQVVQMSQIPGLNTFQVCMQSSNLLAFCYLIYRKFECHCVFMSIAAARNDGWSRSWDGTRRWKYGASTPASTATAAGLGAPMSQEMSGCR